MVVVHRCDCPLGGACGPVPLSTTGGQYRWPRTPRSRRPALPDEPAADGPAAALVRCRACLPHSTAHARRQDLGRPRRRRRARRPDRPRDRPPPRPRGHEPAGLHRPPPAGLRVRRPGQTVATADHSIPTHDRSLPIADAMAAAQVQQLTDNCREFGIPLHGIGSPNQGIVHIIGPELGPDPAGDDDRLRRLAHRDPRRVRGARLRDRHERGRDGPRHPVPPPAPAEDVRGPRRRAGWQPGVGAKDIILALIARIGVGGGTGPRLRVHRLGDPGADHGAADDRLQHEHRGRRAGRARRARRHDVRLRRRPAVRPATARPGTPPSRAGARCRPTPGRRTTGRSRSTPVDARADGHLRHEPGHGDPDHGPDPVARRPARPRRAAGARACARVHGPDPRRADPRSAGRRRVHRQLHERPDQRPAARGVGPPRPQGRRRGPGDGRAGQPGGEARGRERGPRRRLPGRRRRVARGGLLDVHRDERRPARRPASTRSRPRTGTSRAARARAGGRSSRRP